MWSCISPRDTDFRYLASDPTVSPKLPRPGDVFVCRPHSSTEWLQEVRSTFKRWPWVPVVLVGPPTESLQAVRAEVARRGGWVTLDGDASTTDVIAALKGRPCPELADVLELLTALAGEPALGLGVARALRGDTTHRSTVSRRLRRVTGIQRLQWIQLVWLAGAAHRLGGVGRRWRPSRWTVDRIADELCCDVRTLRRRVWHLTGTSPARLANEIAWEWVVAQFAHRSLGIDIRAGVRSIG